MLRESSKVAGIKVCLASVIDRSDETGLDHGNLLMDFTDELIARNGKALDQIRNELTDKLGKRAIVEASVTVATFSMLDRIANAIGIPLEKNMVDMSEDFRGQLGINGYYSAKNTLKNKNLPGS